MDEVTKKELPASYLVMSYHMLSGMSKLLSTGTTIFGTSGRTFDINRLVKKGIPGRIALIIVIMCGLFEVFASGVVLYDVTIDGRLNSMSLMAVDGLIALQLVLTLLFYTFPFKSRTVLMNLGAIGALIFVRMIIQRNAIQNESAVDNPVIQRVNELLREED